MSEKSYTVYESEIIVPLYLEPTTLDFVVERIRERALPILIARFEEVPGHEAQAALAEINMELTSRGLADMPMVTKRRIRQPRS